MSETGVDADHHIGQHAQRRTVAEVFEFITEMAHFRMGTQSGLVVVAQFLLQTQILTIARQMSEQLREWNTAIVVVGMLGIAAPGQCNAWSCARPEACLPLRDTGRVGVQVRSRGGNIVQARTAQAWHAQQGAVEIECRQRLTAGYHFLHACHSAHQLDHRGCHFEDHMGAARRHHLRVATELQSIAEALFAVQ